MTLLPEDLQITAALETARRRAAEIRRLVLEQSYRAGVGHIGPALSIADIIAVLTTGPLAPAPGGSQGQFVLSKGHAALALYCALHLDGVISETELSTYCADGSRLGVHPEHLLAGIEFSTGSLGHGLAVATGRAWAARLRQSARQSYVLLSDAELNEGSTWEAVMFAGHHRLQNVVAVLDRNGQQALGPTASILDLGDVAAKFAAFGWRAVEVDGHDAAQLIPALHNSGQGAPLVVIADTECGHGVSFMERRVEWHYLPLTESQLKQALAEVAV